MDCISAISVLFYLCELATEKYTFLKYMRGVDLMKSKVRKFISVLLMLTILLSLSPAMPAMTADNELLPFETALIEIEATYCTHIHGEDCNYIEGVPCNHEHDEKCEERGADCIHQHDDGCSYVNAVDCNHVHDVDCGELATDSPNQQLLAGI